MQIFGKVPQNELITDHAWLEDEKIVGSSADGEIFWPKGDDEWVSKNAFGDKETLVNISCIRIFSKGFFVSSENGFIAMWVRSEENNSTTGKDSFDYIRRWQPKATLGLKILGMAISPGEETLAVAAKNNTIGLINIKSIGLNEDTNKEIKYE
jgi:hypothetical protein